MGDNELDPMSRVVGGLEAAVKNLTEAWQRQDVAAVAGRQELSNKFDQLKDQVVGAINNFQQAFSSRMTIAEGRISAVEQKLAGVVTDADALKLDHSERKGSKKALAGVWIAVIGLSGTVAAIAMKAMELLWPPRH